MGPTKEETMIRSPHDVRVEAGKSKEIENMRELAMAKISAAMSVDMISLETCLVDANNRKLILYLEWSWSLPSRRGEMLL